MAENATAPAYEPKIYALVQPETTRSENPHSGALQTLTFGEGVTIVSRCRAQAPDLANHELAEITTTEALRAISEKRSNLTGWLITVLPGRLAGESLRIYRERSRHFESRNARNRYLISGPTLVPDRR